MDMKQLISTLLIIFFASSLIAQENEIKITTGFMIVNNVRVQLINIHLPETNSNLEQDFQQWMNEQYDYGLDGGKILEIGNNTFSAIGCYIPEVSNRQMDLFMRSRQDIGKGTTIITFYASLGFDTWINDEFYPFEFRSLSAVIKQFAYTYLYKELAYNQ
jgi:hypothetical protein